MKGMHVLDVTRHPDADGGQGLVVLDAESDAATSPAVGRRPPPLRQWRTEILAYSDTGGMSNGGTEAIDGVIEKTRRLAHGFRNFTNYRIRILLAADGTAPTGVRRPIPISRTSRPRLIYQEPDYPSVAAPGPG